MRKLSTLMTKTTLVAATVMLVTGCSAVAKPQMEHSASSNVPALKAKALDNALLYSDECITEREVVTAQKMWGDGIVRIGAVFSNGGDYSGEAADFIQAMYGYDLSSVLFKPTLAANDQFRSSFDAALSYFVGGNDAYEEDKGFAIKPYTNVKFDNVGIINNSCRMAVAMGNYFFTDTKGGETKVEYTFAYVKDSDGDLRIVAHQSSLPYNPNGN
ncbi:hypothetical protein AMBAS45_11700 [Alteromonas macleodii str. 'Balearic Sea AD45']|uniref:hypothetical protein n=1 Tax=Alteromonas macleodii TaxID=28108 RepID=UPI000286CD63|nr:hypothetical protein [Alteromonas macleodii]AFT95805.1 hypothetical protein AMBAS45_11700 [Alteromonas macleodii str. 'Balearic Sea AD45']PTU03957.1 phosphoribosyl-AMP cyclohydrolase [Pseudomonas sp. HMWF031]